MGPGLYSEIGKKARGSLCIFSADFFAQIYLLTWKFLVYPADLLYKDYQTDHKFTITTCTSNGVVSDYILYLFLPQSPPVMKHQMLVISLDARYLAGVSTEITQTTLGFNFFLVDLKVFPPKDFEKLQIGHSMIDTMLLL